MARYETAQFMIGCDACDRWYHGPCVGVSKAESDAMSEFLCPSCAAAKGVPYRYAQGQPPPRPKRTRRPAARYVAALLCEAEALRVSTPETEAMRQLLEAATADARSTVKEED